MAAVKNGREYLSHVTETLKHRIAQLDESIEVGQKEIEGMHEYYWENYTEMDQYGYENFDNQQALLHQINANEQQIHLRKRFRKMLDSPFFGRVDFIFEGEDEPEIFYIGIGNFAEETGHTPLIYDWRAPVSGLFYDYDKDLLPMKHLLELSPVRLHPNGSTRSVMEKWSTSLRVM